MRSLKAILVSIYPILIILLLLNHCQSNKNTDNRMGGSASQLEELPDTANIIRKARQTGNSGDLKVTLLWAFKGDIDLHVNQPNGTEIYFNAPKDNATGGYLDIDNREGGNGSAENIYWTNPPSGKYEVSLVYYQAAPSNGVAESGVCTVVIFQKGKEPQRFNVEMRSIHEKKDVATIAIP